MADTKPPAPATQPKPAESEAERVKRQHEEEAARRQRDKEKEGKHQAGPKTSSLAYSPGARTGERVPLGDVRGDTFLSDDEISSLAGDIQAGEVGFVKLDEEGTPTGAVLREMPLDPDGSYARVIGSPQRKYDEIVTPSGAPVTRFMNPEPTLWDAGMLARNPITPEMLENKYNTPLGAPVVNQPVAV
jgi:hypothetical protein